MPIRHQYLSPLAVITLLALVPLCKNTLFAQNKQNELDRESQAVLASKADSEVRPVQFEQPLDIQPAPQLPAAPRPRPATNLFQPQERSRGVLSRTRRQQIAAGSDIVSGVEAGARVSTDAGSLLGKSPAALGVRAQKRNPIVTDTRVRGSHVGQLLASGSYWVPARVDLDTLLSKIDSRIIDQMIVIKGPYSSRYGPGFNFVDVELLAAPRYANGFESHGSTSLDYSTNGEQWYGRQTVLAGAQDWGLRVGYGHRTGNDYTTGDGALVASSYKSRDLDVAIGYDVSDETHLEFSYLRLDQTDVEYPGQVFDMDFLATDAFELLIVNEHSDSVRSLETWYNRTRFAGNSQGDSKRQQFPFFDFIQLTGFTDVNSISTGFSLAQTWGPQGGTQWTTGVDTRYVEQELNEVVGFVFPVFGQVIQPIVQPPLNSPIPRSGWVNPGLFSEIAIPVNERARVTAGFRFDSVSTDILDFPANADPSPQVVYGTDEFQRQFFLWSAYLTGEVDLDESWTVTGGAGRAARAPTLTELYVQETFLFVLQNGQNAVIGDPTLDTERLWQMDLGLQYDDGPLRGGVNGYYSWINDYITLENHTIVRFPPGVGPIEQVQLAYVNTRLATISGFEAYCEYDCSSWVTTFATMRYVEGRDRTRNGEFATIPGRMNNPRQKQFGQPRGSNSATPAGGAKEPLPSISPLESRVGLRLHDPREAGRWAVELTARIVDNQDRVARSLEEQETPGFTVYDVRSYWRAREGWLLIFGIENLTNKQYREHLNFIADSGFAVFQPGINFYFASQLTY